MPFDNLLVERDDATAADAGRPARAFVGRQTLI